VGSTERPATGLVAALTRRRGKEDQTVYPRLKAAVRSANKVKTLDRGMKMTSTAPSEGMTSNSDSKRCHRANGRVLACSGIQSARPAAWLRLERLVELSLAVDEIVPCPDRGPPQSVGRGDQLMCQLAWRALWDGFWTSEVKTMID
jgi:hypothetical protein